MAAGRSRLVVDASVAAKWLLPELGSEAAAGLLDEDVELHVPELFDLELCNVLWKRVRRGELGHGEALGLVELVVRIPAQRHPHRFFVTHALSLAIAGSFTAYDAVYVSLARALDATLATADKTLVRQLEDGGVDVGVRSIS